MSRDLATSATGAVAREEQCYIMYIRVSDGVAPDQGYAIRDALNDAGTNGWWFLNPGTFFAVFMAADAGAKRLVACETAMAGLAAEHPSWPAASVGTAEGPVFGAFTSAGILESLPSGAAVSTARRNASGDTG